jgi:hypothetical protein
MARSRRTEATLKHARFDPDERSFGEPTKTTNLNFAEAATVAAGFKYRQVECSGHCPTCFSRPILSYAISFDAFAPFELREELLFPFLTRLANTAATKEIEIARGNFIALETFRRVVPMFCLDVWKQPEFAERCRAAKNNQEAVALCLETGVETRDVGCTCVPGRAGALSGNHRNTLPFRDAYVSCCYAGVNHPDNAALGAGWVVMRCCYRARSERRRRYFTAAAQILDEAIALGARA